MVNNTEDNYCRADKGRNDALGKVGILFKRVGQVGCGWNRKTFF